MLKSLAGLATATGSHPGTDPAEAAKAVVGELSLTYLPELPARGLGADMIGRTAAQLIDIPLDNSTTGYRIGVSAGPVARAARGFLAADLDAFDAARELIRSTGPIKLQFAGPLTLAAALELRSGHRAAKDLGASRDLAESLAETIVVAIGRLGARFGADIVIQLDEPAASSVLEGTVPALTRLDPIRPLPLPEARDVLGIVTGAVVSAGAQVIVHDCGPNIPWDLYGTTPVSLDLPLVLRGANAGAVDAIGTFLDKGGVLGAGIVDPRGTAPEPPPEKALEQLVKLVDRLGLSRDVIRDQAFATTACGLAGTAPSAVVGKLTAVRKAAELLGDPAAL